MYIVCIWGFKSYWGLVKRQRRHVSECMLFNKTSGPSEPMQDSIIKFSNFVPKLKYMMSIIRERT